MDGFPITSGTNSHSFHGGELDAFLIWINREGDQIFYSTMIGDSGDERGYALSLIEKGKVLVGGQTTSPCLNVSNGLITGFPERPYPLDKDPFVILFDFKKTFDPLTKEDMT